MKSKEEIISEIEKIFRYRLNLRKERMKKNSCRNCARGVRSEKLDDGVKYIVYRCSDGLPFNYEGKCSNFKCLYNDETIEGLMKKDIEDPSIRSAKEPKIAALLWVLQDSEKSWIGKLWEFFKK